MIKRLIIPPWAAVMVLIPALLNGADALSPSDHFTIEKVTTKVPFPRGLVLRDEKLFVLSRGRVRGAGGVSAAVNDRAGTIFIVDPDITQPAGDPELSEAVRDNGVVLVEPTSPPFRLWDRSSDPPESDRLTDRPYCVLRFHEPSHSFYMCAFSGIDKPRRPGQSSFSKNLTDALFRYDLRTQKWYEVERHDIEAGGAYPHHDPRYARPPHGWLNGPDNCLVVGNWLYVVAKDNNRLVRYDLTPYIDDPEAPPPAGEPILDEWIDIAGQGRTALYGHSTLASDGEFLYVGYRTSSVIVRFPLKPDGAPVMPIRAELVARFEPYDPQTKKSADLTDIDLGSDGYLYAVSAKPARIHRFKPDAKNVYDATDPQTPAWLELAQLLNNPKMKSENILVDSDGRLYVTSGDGYAYQSGADGTVYRVTPR